MSVEILSVSLSDESIERLANRVANLLNGNQPVTLSNPPSSQNPQPAAEPAFQPEADPWLNGNGAAPAPQAQYPTPQNAAAGNYAPPQQQYQPQQQPAVSTAPAERFCPHGKMRFVPAGTNSQGKAYNAFYGCPLPRGDANQCRPVRV